MKAKILRVKRIIKFFPSGIVIAISFYLMSIIPAYAFFKEIGAARPTGMGGAFIAVADDTSALLWNPAGVAQIEDTQISFMYAQPAVTDNRPDLKLNYVAFVQPLGKNLGTIGIGWTGVDFSDLHREDTFILNYGVDLEAFITLLDRDTIYTGFSLKSLNYIPKTAEKDSLDLLLFDSREKETAITADWGILCKPTGRLSLGMSVKNLTQPTIELETEEEIALKLGIGAAWQVDEDKILALDLSRQEDEWQVNIGGEIWFLDKKIGLRSGINLDTGAIGISLGKLFYKNIDLHLDYTFEYPFDSEENDLTHWFSLGARIGKDRDLSWDETYEEKETEEVVPYLLGPDDEVEVLVRKHPEFSTAAKVDPYGNIVIPLLGEMGVEGMTRQEVANALEKDLLSYIGRPKVSVVITEYRSKVVYVLGQVNRPGKYYIEGEKLTLREVIFQAGLPTNLAALWRVYIIKSRNEENPPYKVVNLYKLLYKGELKNNINLEPGDIVYVPLTLLGKISSSLAHLLDPFYKTRALAQPIDEGSLLPKEE